MILRTSGGTTARCSTPYGITARCMSEAAAAGRGRHALRAQRLTASRLGAFLARCRSSQASYAVLNALRHHGSVHRLADAWHPWRHGPCAQRLTASRLGAWLDGALPPGRLDVLNALRHHGSVHSSGIPRNVPAGHARCSTPYGITARCIVYSRTRDRTRSQRAQRLTASRLGASVTSHRATPPDRVLNALRHHGSVHTWTADARATALAACSTPYGITARCIARAVDRRHRAPRAQRLTASRLGASRAGAARRSDGRLCSTPYGITARCIEHVLGAVVMPSPCAQRLTASRLGASTQVSRRSRPRREVLNALRHHGSVHSAAARATHGSSHVLNALRHHGSVHLARLYAS